MNSGVTLLKIANSDLIFSSQSQYRTLSLYITQHKPNCFETYRYWTKRTCTYKSNV